MSLRVKLPFLVVADVEQGFLPWLMDEVEKDLHRKVVGRAVLDALIRDVVAQRAQAYKPAEVPAPTPAPATPAATPAAAAPAEEAAPVRHHSQLRNKSHIMRLSEGV